MAISRSYANTTAVFAILCFLCGAGVSVVSWILSSKAPTQVVITDGAEVDNANFRAYWWGGLGFLLPGILGIIASTSRNSCVMVLYLVFNVLSMFAAGGMIILVTLVFVVWLEIDERRKEDLLAGCVTVNENCVCGDLQQGKAWMLQGISCDELGTIKMLLVIVIALGGLSVLFSFISSYVSCCSLCDQEQETGVVIHRPSAQNTVIIGQTANMAYPQPPYTHQPHQAQPYDPNNAYPPPYMPQSPSYALQHHSINTKDTAKLMRNQVV